MKLSIIKKIIVRQIIRRIQQYPRIWIIKMKDAQEYELFASREINVHKDRDVYTVEISDVKERRAFLDLQIRNPERVRTSDYRCRGQ